MWMPLSSAVAATWPDLDPAPTPGAASPDAAVVVGIDAYPFLDDVPGARSNAEDWFRWFTRTRGVPPARVHLLRDVEGTREKVIRALGDAAREVQPGGSVWLVFVGHGVTAPDGSDGLLVGADAQPDPDGLYARSIRRAELQGAVGTTPAVWVLDTCFSGRSGRGPLLPDLQFAVPAWTARPTAATVLTAASGDQFAGPLPGGGRPAFSYLVLGALTGWGDADRDGTVTASEAVAYARDAIAGTVRGRAQTPELSGPDVPLARAAARPGPDLVELAIAATAPAASGGPLDPSELAARRDAIDAERIAAAREASRLAALAESVRGELAAEAARAGAEAQAEWSALQARVAASDPAVRPALEAFVARWTGARVRVGEEEERVDVRPLAEAVAALARDTPVAAVAPSPADVVGTSVYELWAEGAHAWRDDVAADPARIFDPYRRISAHALHLEGEWVDAVTRVGPAEVAPLEDLARDARAYGEAWWGADADRRREIEHVLLGMVEEARDASTAARRGRFHVDALRAGKGLPADLVEASVAGGPALPWLAAEVSRRAAHAGPACAREQDALAALAETPPGADAKAVARWGARLVRLADQVHTCSGT